MANFEENSICQKKIDSPKNYIYFTVIFLKNLTKISVYFGIINF